MTALCNHCISQSPAPPRPLAAPPAGDQTLQRTTQRLRLAPPTSRQVGKPTNRQVGNPESWQAPPPHNTSSPLPPHLCHPPTGTLSTPPPRSRPPSCLAGRPPPAGPSPLARFHALSSRGDPHQHQPQHQRVNKPRSRKAGKLATTPPTPYSPPPDPPSAAKRPTVAPLALPAG